MDININQKSCRSQIVVTQLGIDSIGENIFRHVHRPLKLRNL